MSISLRHANQSTVSKQCGRGFPSAQARAEGFFFKGLRRHALIFLRSAIFDVAKGGNAK